MFIFADTGPIDNLRQIGEQTGFSLPHLFSQAVAFLIVCASLTYFAYKPVRNILEERRQTIEQAMANADRIKKELADAEASRLDIIRKANEQADAIIAQAQKGAAIQTERRLQEATVQAQEILRKAHEAGVLDRDRLMGELKRQVGALVIQTTEKIAGKVLTSDDQARLNDETLHQLSAGNN